MAKIYAVRHAESIANTKGIYQGQSFNTDLSELGKRQALLLAKRLCEYNIQKIITSPLKRAMQTAKPAAVLTAADVEICKDIIETNHGDWEGKNKLWVRQNYPDIYKKWQEAPGEVVFPQGEAFIDTVNRVEKFIKRRNWKANTLVVTHDNIIRIMICLAQRCAINDLWKCSLESAAISTFNIKGVNGKKELTVVDINDVNHLKEDRADLTCHAF